MFQDLPALFISGVKINQETQTFQGQRGRQVENIMPWANLDKWPKKRKAYDTFWYIK